MHSQPLVPTLLLHCSTHSQSTHHCMLWDLLCNNAQVNTHNYPHSRSCLQSSQWMLFWPCSHTHYPASSIRGQLEWSGHSWKPQMGWTLDSEPYHLDLFTHGKECQLNALIAQHSDWSWKDIHAHTLDSKHGSHSVNPTQSHNLGLRGDTGCSSHHIMHFKSSTQLVCASHITHHTSLHYTLHHRHKRC